MKFDKIKNNEIKLKNLIYNKNNFKKFLELDTDWSIKSVDRKDLPPDISDEVCEFIDIFRRKTSDEDTEWNFYIDYENNEIIHCLHGGATSVNSKINADLMKNRKILTIHNHPKGTYSAPSATNFEILHHEFEDYEIICAENEYWILEAKGSFEIGNPIKKGIENIFKSIQYSNYPNKNTRYSEHLKILTI